MARRQVLGFIFSVNAILSFQSAHAQDKTQQCEFYRETAEVLHCPADNYLMKHGYKYCRRFAEMNDQFRPQTQVTLQYLRSCLIQALDDRADLTCENVEGIAIESHFECYQKSDFCQLTRPEKLKIFWVIKSLLKDPNYRQLFVQVQAMCRHQN